MTAYTSETLTQITGETFEQTDIDNFNDAIATQLDPWGDIDTYLIGLTTDQQWGVYEIASSLEVAFNTGLNIVALETRRANNWVALSAKAAGQGHLVRQ